MEEKRVFRTREERLVFARSMNFFSTPFMRLVFKDRKATQYALRILMGKPDLIIRENLTEDRISKLDTSDAVLDVIAADSNGVGYHVEIQLADSDDHIRRMRFYSAMVDSEMLEKGTKYSDLPNTYIFYITRNDFMDLGEPISLINRTVGKKKKKYDDGKYIYLVNAAVDDASEVARMMNYFKLADPYDSSHGDLSERVHLLKVDPEGEDAMCEITQSFVEEGKIIGVVEYLRKEMKLSDEEIIEKIKDHFQLNDFQARTFVYPKETA